MRNRFWIPKLALLCAGWALAPIAQAQDPQAAWLCSTWSFGSQAHSSAWTLGFQARTPGHGTLPALPLLEYSAKAKRHSIAEGEEADSGPSLWPYALGAAAIAVAVALAGSDDDAQGNTENGPNGNGAGILCTAGECVIPCESSPDCLLQGN